jgi:hypothetical protein
METIVVQSLQVKRDLLPWIRVSLVQHGMTQSAEKQQRQNDNYYYGADTQPIFYISPLKLYLIAALHR